MQSQTLARGIAAGAVLVAAAFALRVRAPIDLPPDVPAEASPPTEPRSESSADLDPAAQPPETPADAKGRELEAMSETFRNTTFLIAIRDAGFACNELLRVSGGLDGAAKWLATCSEMLAYTVAVASNGTLHVEPMMQYFDSQPGLPALELEPETEFILPPEQLRQQQLRRPR